MLVRCHTDSEARRCLDKLLCRLPVAPWRTARATLYMSPTQLQQGLPPAPRPVCGLSRRGRTRPSRERVFEKRLALVMLLDSWAIVLFLRFMQFSRLFAQILQRDGIQELRHHC